MNIQEDKLVEVTVDLLNAGDVFLIEGGYRILGLGTMFDNDADNKYYWSTFLSNGWVSKISGKTLVVHKPKATLVLDGLPNQHVQALVNK